MKIVPQSLRPAANTKKKKSSDSIDNGSFAGLLSEAENTDETASSAPLQSTAPMSGIDSMLSFQEVSDEDVTKRRELKQGRITLDKLEQLHHSLLIGSVPLHLLKDIEQLVARQRNSTSHPALNAILDDIELRAAVELAKLEARR